MTKEEREEARRSGLVRYISDTPCCRGHLAERYTSTGNCVPCNTMRNAEAYETDPQKFKAWQAKWVANNLDRKRFHGRNTYHRKYAKDPEGLRVIRRRSDKGYRRRYPEKIRELKREWKRKNPDKAAAQCAHRRASKIKRTPAWADLNEIKCFYYRAQEMFEATGQEYEVDHIVPLRSPVVCGLHVESNLQIVTAAFNSKKSNAFNAGYSVA